MPRFAATGRRSTPQLGQLPRSVQQLGLPPGGRSLGQPVQQPRRPIRIPTPQGPPQRGVILSRAYQNEVIRQQQNNQRLSDYLTQATQPGGGRDFGDRPSNDPPNVQQLMERHGLNSDEAELLQHILASQHAQSLARKPTPILSQVFKGLNATVAASAALANAQLKQDYDTSSPGMAAWSYINALGHGFREMPAAVKEGYDYTALIKERNNPGSFLYRWALPIGTGLDVALDPITYVSGGSASVDRIAYMRIIRLQDDLAMPEARQAIKEGTMINPETMTPYTEHYFDEVLGRVRMKNRASWSPGDAAAIHEALGTNDWPTIEKALIKHSRPSDAAGALTRREVQVGMRQEGRAFKSAARRGQKGKAAFVGGYLRPTSVKGRGGIGFGGLEVPGTARAGEAIGGAIRRGATAAYEAGGGGRLYQRLAKDFVPNAVLRHVNSDLERARAIFLQHDIRDALNAAPTMAFEKSIEHLSKSNLFKEVKQEKLIPGKPSTTGPESGLIFSHNGGFIHPEDAADGMQHHNIYNENNDLLGSVTWYPGSVFNPHEIDASTIYIRPESRNLENYFKLLDPLIKEAQQSGKTVVGHFLNHQLADVMEKKAEQLGIPFKAYRINSRLSQEAARIAAEQGGRVRKRGRQVPIEVPAHNLPDLATPDTVEQIMGHQLLGTVAEIAPYRVRRDVHAMGVSKMTDAQRHFREMYDNRLGLWRKQAKGAGYKFHDIEDTIRKYEQTNSDPLSVLAHLSVDMEMKKIVKSFRDNILSDPRYAFPLKKTRESERGSTIYRADPPQGYETYRRGDKYWAVRTPIKHALETLDNTPYMRLLHDLNTKGPFGQVTDWWKAMATMPNPSFHAMNFVGAVWNNRLAQVYGFPHDYIKHYFRTVHPARLERAAIHGRPTLEAPLRALRGQAPKSTKGTKEALVRMREGLEQRGAFGRQSFIAETEATLGSDVLDLAGPQGFRRLFQPGPSLEMKKPGLVFKTGGQRLAARRVRQAVAIGGTAIPGVGLASLALLMPDLARFGVKHLAGPIETIVRITPYLEHAGDERLLRYLKNVEDAAGPPRPPNFKFEGYTKRQKEVAGDIAADVVKRFQFDYTDVTPFEQSFIRTVFPFYTYYRKNFVVQAQELVRQPRTLAYVNALQNYLNQKSGDLGPMDAILPQYFAQMDAFQIPLTPWMKQKIGVPKDQPVFINPKLPFATLNMFPPLWDVMSNPEGVTPQQAGQILAPVFGSVGPHTLIPGSKIAMEYIANWSFGMNRPIDFQRRQSNDYRNSIVDAPFYAKFFPKPLRGWLGIQKDARCRYTMSASGKYILEQTASPFISNFGSAIPAEGATESEKGKAISNRVALITGLRLMPVDMHRLSKNHAYGLKNLLEAKQSDLRHRGQELDEQDTELLTYARLLTEVAKGVDDERYYELYGKAPGEP